jgi:hypothetical protein
MMQEMSYRDNPVLGCLVLLQGSTKYASEQNCHCAQENFATTWPQPYLADMNNRNHVASSSSRPEFNSNVGHT